MAGRALSQPVTIGDVQVLKPFELRKQHERRLDIVSAVLESGDQRARLLDVTLTHGDVLLRLGEALFEIGRFMRCFLFLRAEHPIAT
jgi:hypothetical protein